MFFSVTFYNVVSPIQNIYDLCLEAFAHVWVISESFPVTILRATPAYMMLLGLIKTL